MLKTKLLAHILILFLIPTAFAINTQSNNTTPDIQYFLALGDIHFDPFIGCHAKPCPLVHELQNKPAEQWSKIFAEYDKQLPKFKQDTNYVLLTSALNAASQAANDKHAQFILLLGDSLGHDLRSRYKKYAGDRSKSGYQAFCHKLLAFLTLELKAAFPDRSVYAVVGNNDTYQGDYVMKYNGPFFNDAASLWSDLIVDEGQRLSMRSQFSSAGYYSVSLAQPSNVRLIILNSNYFSYKAKGNSIDEIAIKELNWLHGQLLNAKESNQHVIIAMHMPEAIDIYVTLHTRLFRLMTFWKSSYIQRFQAEIENFSPIIAGIFTAHLHRDRTQILTIGNNEVPVIGVVSVSPIFDNEPGFKMCAYADNALRLDDFINYSYPIQGDNTWKQTRAQMNDKRQLAAQHLDGLLR